ncbi:MAG: hypothetical protein NVS1B4_24050 [Gemmatimonadaceae bacterium]
MVIAERACTFRERCVGSRRSSIPGGAHRARNGAGRGAARSPLAERDHIQITPYLNFDSRCREAFEFYATSLGGKIEVTLTHADSPMKDKTPSHWRDKIMHARMTTNADARGLDRARAQRLLGTASRLGLHED